MQAPHTLQAKPSTDNGWSFVSVTSLRIAVLNH
jgi:hypothetical protein